MNQFHFHNTPIAGLRIIERMPIADQRGIFERIFCQKLFDDLLAGRTIRQINHTLTKKVGTIRGMHFQYPPHAEIKIVSCIKGKIWDVAVDLRKGSPTFLKHHAVLLSDDTPYSYFIPEGFAHGFQALTSDCELIYLHTADHNVSAGGGLNALDPRLGIQWPEAVGERSFRDQQCELIHSTYDGIRLV